MRTSGSVDGGSVGGEGGGCGRTVDVLQDVNKGFTRWRKPAELPREAVARLWRIQVRNGRRHSKGFVVFGGACKQGGAKVDEHVEDGRTIQNPDDERQKAENSELCLRAYPEFERHLRAKEDRFITAVVAVFVGLVLQHVGDVVREELKNRGDNNETCQEKKSEKLVRAG